MNQIQIEACCDLGVKNSCVTCDYSRFCNGKWSHSTGESVSNALEA